MKTNVSSKSKTGGQETKKSASKLAESVLKPEEIGRIIDLGLGRGVDATQSSPWLQKSTFQVQEVTMENVLGTEEGGILQSYVEEIESVEELQLLMGASVPVSDKVTVGIDAELSRSYSTSRRSIGTKIITRSISFKPNFDALLEHKAVTELTAVTDLIHSHQPAEETLTDEKTSQAAIESKLGELLPLSDNKKINFEQRLASWIIDSFIDDEIEVFDEVQVSNDPTAVLAHFILKRRDDVDGLKQVLENKCREFVHQFNITHYVSGINLGAAKYQVMSEEQYQLKVGVKNKLDILKLASVNTETKRSITRRKKSSRTTEIGRFEEGKVHRGTTDEAVVGVEFRPISALIKVRVLRTSLQKAIKEYIDDQQYSRGKIAAYLLCIYSSLL